MTQAATAAAAAPTTLALMRTLVGVGMGCALLIVSVHEATAPIIADNHAAARRAAVLKVVPGSARGQGFALEASAFSPRDDAPTLFAAYDEGGNLKGLAIEAQAMGYQDEIRVLYGYDLGRQAIVGLSVLESRETPGLGDKIETDPAFLDNFVQLDVSLDAEGDALAHPLKLTPRGQRAGPGQIDAITGATISSRAIADMLAESIARWAPLLQARRGDFEEAP